VIAIVVLIYDLKLDDFVFVLVLRFDVGYIGVMGSCCV